MLCEVARQLLVFRRPGELPADELTALDRHLAGCPHCAAVAQRQEAFDSAVATAFKAVTIPDGFRERLLTDALAHRGARLRRKVAEYIVWTAIGISGLALIPGVYALATRDSLNTELIAASFERPLDAPEPTVRTWLVDRGLPPSLPRDFDFTFYKRHGHGELQGKLVPMIRFETIRPGNHQPDFVEVYVVRGRQFRWSKAKDAQNSFVTVTVITDDARELAYVFVHTAPLELFLRPPRPIT